MTSSERAQFAQNRLAAAYETLAAARLLAENGFWNSAVNRLYYASFYAVNALLVKNEIYPHSHSGIKNQFSLHFIRTGKISLKTGKLFSELFDWRQKGDYGHLFDFNENLVQPLFDPVLALITEIEREISSTSK